MYNKLNATAKGKRIRSLAAVVLAAGVLFSLSAWAPVNVQAVDLTENCSLKISPGNIDDLANADVVIDLYKVADAVEVPGHSTYRYAVTPAYSELGGVLSDEKELTNEAYQAAAARAARITFSEGNSVGKAVDGAAANTEMQELKSGLYLVIARGAGLTEEEYVVTDGDGAVTTVANSREYTYSYLPELVALPSTTGVLSGEADAEGNRQEVMTSGGDWVYNISAVLKPSQALRFGSLQIEKTLLSYAAGAPATFVFQVEAYEDESRQQVVYSNVVSLSFTSAGQQTALIEDMIPVGSYVEVQEIYSGAAYSRISAELQTAVIVADSAASVAFTNEYNQTHQSGGAVTNHFEYAEGEGWNWTQISGTE